MTYQVGDRVKVVAYNNGPEADALNGLEGTVAPNSEDPFLFVVIDSTKGVTTHGEGHAYAILADEVERVEA